MQAIGHNNRSMLSSCPTQNLLHLESDRCRTPTPGSLSQRFVSHRDDSLDRSESGARTPKGAQARPLVDAGCRTRPTLLSPPIDAQAGTTTIYVGEPKRPNPGAGASQKLWAALDDADSHAFARLLNALSAPRILQGLRFNDYAVIVHAAEMPERFGALKAALAALPNKELRTVVCRHSGPILAAAQAAGDLDYANWLIWAHGDGQTQLISER